MIYCDNIFGRMITDITHIYYGLHGTMCLYQKRMAHYEHMHYILTKIFFIFSRYNNMFECIYHIVVYRDIFLQCRDIVIQKISYRGITNTHTYTYIHTYIHKYIQTQYGKHTHSLVCI